ncbi:MAG: glycosyltransferase [Gammaproteobacteria bacterium]|nr:glycosyltransferase [Gammaproteobacteria bacterium]
MSPHTASIIIPCFNGERFLAEAIDAALAQTYPRCEVIVVDDGSSDGSAAIMQKYAGRIRVVQQANAGLPAARNAGIRVSTGGYLAFLDADDYWRQDFIEKMVQALETSGAAIAYCGWQNVGLPDGRGKPFIPPDYEHEQGKLERLVGGVRWPVHAALVRRHAVEAVGGFDPKWTSCEDFAFWIRAATRHALVRVPEVLAFYRHHGRQMTKNRALIAHNHWRVQREFLREHPEVEKRLGRRRIRELTHGEMLRKGYESYWQGDLETARAIFRTVMKTGYGAPGDWRYMLPALLPLPLHQALIRLMDRNKKEKPLSEND